MEIKNLEGFDRIDAVDVFQDELTRLYKKSKSELKEYKKFLYAQLHNIDNQNDHPNREEPIKYKDVQFYSIRKRLVKNTRTLYFSQTNGRIVLLTAFDEKNRSDYERGKERAYNRLKQLGIKGEIENE